MNLNKKRNVTKITAKNVTLTTKMSPLKKKYNFVSHLWYEIATYRDLKFVVPNTDQNVLPGNFKVSELLNLLCPNDFISLIITLKIDGLDLSRKLGL